MTETWRPTNLVAEWAKRAPEHGRPDVRDVDILACVPEFRDYWIGRSDKVGIKTTRGWDATFRDQVCRLLEQGRAPMLPPLPTVVPTRPAASQAPREPSAPTPTDAPPDAATRAKQAADVAALLNGAARTVPEATKVKLT
jgi:hypothetical protein